MEAIQQDERAGVQKAWVQFEKRMAKKQQIVQAHHMKNARSMRPFYLIQKRLSLELMKRDVDLLQDLL